MFATELPAAVSAVLRRNDRHWVVSGRAGFVTGTVESGQSPG